MNSLVAIYVLRDPRNGLVRYVGKAVDPCRRLREHRYRKTNTHCSRWIFGLLTCGCKPKLEVARWVAESECEVVERKLIQFFREVSPAPLTNICEGGEGGATGLVRSSETRAKISATKVGKKRQPFSREYRVKVSVAMRGNKHSLGHKHSPETLAKLSALRRGVKRGPHSPARVAAMTAARWPHSK